MDKSTRTCSIDGCEKPSKSRGWCVYHYQRAWATGDPLTPRKKRKPRLDAACREECSVEGCGRIVGTQGGRGYCAMHYSRFRRTGSAGQAGHLRIPVNPDACAVDDCSGAVHARGLCNRHLLRWYKFGNTSTVHEPSHWTPKGMPCGFCAGAIPDAYNSRRFCSAVCARMFRAYDGKRPESKPCVRCNGMIDLMSKTKAGQYKRVDAKMCPECRKARMTRHGWSVKAIVAHHGITDCGICGDPVDLTLKAPDMMRPSIDHIVPFAHGGSNEPENLQLAHLHCNHVKSDSGYKRGRRVPMDTIA